MAEGSNKLSEENIFECLKSLNVPVRMNELKYPTREFIIRVFECFLRDLQIDISSHVLRPWEATKHIEEDMYEEGQCIALLAMSMNHIASYFGINITVKDIVDPKPKRTKKILNYLIVFWKYYLEMYSRFNAVEETFEQERKKAESLMDEIESLDEKIVEFSNHLQNMQPNKEELEKIYNEKSEKAAKLKEKSTDLQTAYGELKKKEFTLNQQLNAIDLDIVKAKEALGELSQLILSSPKQKSINAEIKVLEEKIRDIDAKTKDCESLFKDEVKKLQLLEDYQKDEEKVKNSLAELHDIHKQLSETVKDMVDVHQQIDDIEDKVKRLQTDLESKEDKHFQHDQKSAKILLNKKKQLEAIKDLLKLNQSEEIKLKKQLKFVKSAVEEAQDKIDRESDTVLDVIRRCKESDARGKEREAQFKSKLKEICDSFKSDCDEVKLKIDEAFPYEF